MNPLDVVVDPNSSLGTFSNDTLLATKLKQFKAPTGLALLPLADSPGSLKPVRLVPVSYTHLTLPTKRIV